MALNMFSAEGTRMEGPDIRRYAGLKSSPSVMIPYSFGAKDYASSPFAPTNMYSGEEIISSSYRQAPVALFVQDMSIWLHRMADVVVRSRTTHFKYYTAIRIHQFKCTLILPYSRSRYTADLKMCTRLRLLLLCNPYILSYQLSSNQVMPNTSLVLHGRRCFLCDSHQ